jgi:LmbE family N-acetylglucosaminyl deacetylase
MVFTTAIDDVYPDHRAVARVMEAALKTRKEEIPHWQYTVWNPWFWKHRDQPRFVVDITSTIRIKWKAIQAYKSQRISTFQLIPTVLLRGAAHGWANGCQAAEVFLKLP